jgi:hypothetical protein
MRTSTVVQHDQCDFLPENGTQAIDGYPPACRCGSQVVYFTSPMTSPFIRLVDQSSQEFMGGHIARQDDAKSPGSDGASPYPRWHLLRYLWQLPPIGLANESSQEFMGVMLFASGGARTHNLRLRRPTLYPVELRTRIARMVNLLLGGVKHSRGPCIRTIATNNSHIRGQSGKLRRCFEISTLRRGRKHATDTDNCSILSSFACEIDHLGI